MKVSDDHLAILKCLANLPSDEGYSAHTLSNRLMIQHEYIRKLVDELEDAHFVERDGPGHADAILITWSGRQMVRGALGGGVGTINVHNGFVQVGHNNVQDVGDHDDADEDEEDDDYEDEDDEDDCEDEDE